MSSIEEKLKTIREIQQSLSELQSNLKQDQGIIDSELSQLNSRWSDQQMAVFKSGEYVGKFKGALGNLVSRLDKALSFLDNKYATLESHRN